MRILGNDVDYGDDDDDDDDEDDEYDDADDADDADDCDDHDHDHDAYHTDHYHDFVMGRAGPNFTTCQMLKINKCSRKRQRILLMHPLYTQIFDVEALKAMGAMLHGPLAPRKNLMAGRWHCRFWIQQTWCLSTVASVPAARYASP